MDISDDESCLIHSKFRKAQRQFASRQACISSTSSFGSFDEGTLSKPQEDQVESEPSASSDTSKSHEGSGSSSSDTVVEGEEQMHIECDHPPPIITTVESCGEALVPSSTSSSSSSSGPSRSHLIEVFGGVPGTCSGSVEGAPKSPILFGTTGVPVLLGGGGILHQTPPLIGSTSSSSSRHMPTGPTGSSTYPCEVFRFDSTDRERYLCSAISEEEEVFSPGPSPSSLSTRSYDSPQIILDSPRITISPLRLQDSPPLISANTPSPIMESQNRLMARVHPGLAMLPPPGSVEQGRMFGIPSSPVSPLTPNTPLSPSPLFSSDHSTFQQGFLAELYRRRCHSDSDLPLLPESTNTSSSAEPTDLTLKMGMGKASLHAKTRKQIPHPLTIPSKGGSLESDQSSPQDSPLDLSMRGSRERFSSSTSCESLTTTRFVSSLAMHSQSSPAHSPGVSVIRGDISSPTTRNSVALRYNLEVSPVVEEMPPGADMAFVCPMCGQMFSLHDRLAKHMASRHKSKPHDPNKSYPCEICHRSFARSDMLTRHVRLHTGIKPYTCKICGQVFSRSDHLSTHQRTHTGEKPYKCPQCPYSACRRDMITRHLRTHTRNSSSSSSTDPLGNVSTPTSMSDFFPDERQLKVEHSRPPSSSSSFAPDSPLSPALHISSLSVNSPPPS